MRALILILVGGLALILGPALSLSQDGPTNPGGKSGKGSKSKGNKGGGGSGERPPGEMKSKGKSGPPRSDGPGGGMVDPSSPRGSSMKPGSFPSSPDEARGGREKNSATLPGFSGMTGFAPGGRGATDPVAAAGSWFRRQDQDGDGVLSNAELDEALRAERALWDMNGDGFIDQGEYLEYFQARTQQWQAERDEQGTKSTDEASRERGARTSPLTGGLRGSQPADGRPTVYRVGNLPRDLPSWFQEYDQDKDGQVGLYEWRRNNSKLDEFHRHDQNNDGFVTAEEILRSQNWSNLLAGAQSPGTGNFGFASRFGGASGREGPGKGKGPSSGREGPGKGKGPGGPSGGFGGMTKDPGSKGR